MQKTIKTMSTVYTQTIPDVDLNIYKVVSQV